MAGHTTVKVTLKVCPIRSEKSTPRARVSTDRTPTLSSLRTKHAETTAKDSVYTTLPYNNVFPGFGKHRASGTCDRHAPLLLVFSSTVRTRRPDRTDAIVIVGAPKRTNGEAFDIFISTRTRRNNVRVSLQEVLDSAAFHGDFLHAAVRRSQKRNKEEILCLSTGFRLRCFSR